jgi:2-methylcitrate dehydratase PrpD
MTAPATPVTADLADFALDARWQDFPAAVRREALRSWLNWVGCALGGASTPAMDAAVRGALALRGGDVPLLGRPEHVSLADAALLNCLGSSAHTFDDTHLATITHPTGPVAGALGAAAHRLAAGGEPVSGTRLLAALVVGMEIECRASLAMRAGGAHGGWYPTGLAGGIGAAAAVARLLGLPHPAVADAIALAAAQACGFRAVHGSMAITYVPGVAARNGLESAYMAAAGFTCSAIAIDGRNSLLQVLTGGTDASALRDGLGRHFEVLSNAYKPYPCGIVIHPAIDACLALVHAQGVAAGDIEHVALRVHPDALALTWRKLPPTALEAQVSLFHWVAAALVKGAAGLAEGREDCVHDPAVRALQERTQAEADPALASDQALVRLTLRDGTVRERFTEHASGSVANPMSDAQLAQKFVDQARPVLGAARADLLLALCLATESLADVAEIFEQGVP